jgi:pimeloyl-ACP methyl ester carboxylesterase
MKIMKINIAYLITAITSMLIFNSCGSDPETAAQEGSSLSLGFPSDFTPILDSGGQGTGTYIKGFGGDLTTDKSGNRTLISSSGKRVVILIHGNGSSADRTWDSEGYTGFAYRKGLKTAGYPDACIWALSYQGHDDYGNREAATYNGVRANIDDVRNFINAVIEYTGVSKVDIIAISQGCLMSRGYILGFQSDGTFNTSDRKLSKIGSVVLLSGPNYGLGKDVTSGDDYDSDSVLYNLTQANNFNRVDNVTNYTPNSPTIKYYCIYAAYDYPDYCYDTIGQGHPECVNTSRLGSAPYFEIPATYGGYNFYLERDGGAPYYNIYKNYLYQNHVWTLYDESIFTNYVLPNINN